MSSSLRMKQKHQRLLGSTRSSIVADGVPKFPPLKSKEQGLNYEGIHGSAMTVPPQKALSESRSEQDGKIPKSPKRSMPSSKSTHSTSSSYSDCNTEKKELKDGLIREKELRNEVTLLRKTIEELNVQLTARDSTYSAMQEKLKSQEDYYKILYEKEKQEHGETKLLLESKSGELELKKRLIDQMSHKHQEDIEKLQQQWERKLSDLDTAKNKEISIRDGKLNKLKLQIADALKGNSWERQQQLDELTKELSKVQEEAEMLKFKIRTMQKNVTNKQGRCDNCEAVSLKLNQANKSISDKDKLIKDLKSLCVKFEKQLSQQDVLLKQFTKNKDPKVTAFPT